MNKRRNVLLSIAVIMILFITLIQGCGGTAMQGRNGPDSGGAGASARPGTAGQRTEKINAVTGQGSAVSTANSPDRRNAGRDGDNSGGQTEGREADNANGQNGMQSDAQTAGKAGDGHAGDGTDGKTDGPAGNGRMPLTPEQLDAIKPDESGKIMVVMFHNFVKEYKKGDKLYTTTFEAFSRLLGKLYDAGYRLISFRDYLDGNIDIPAGCIPMVFTFDDGTSGQFNLIDENGILKANPESAVGIMEEFGKSHPDFGLKGTFYINLGNQTFSGAGTIEQRLRYLINEGFELGNHTYSHINLRNVKTAGKIQEEIGGNQKKMYEVIPGYAFDTFSLPYGAPSKDLTGYVVKGEYGGVKYENRGIVEVGWDPAPSPFSAKFNPLSTHRVRASGITPVQADLAWWLENLKRNEQYVSDGDPATVTVPEASASRVDRSRLGGRRLEIY